MAWEKLSSQTLSGTEDTIDSGTITAKTFLQLLSHTLNSGTIHPATQFNSDTANNYATRDSLNGGADSTATSVGYLLSVAPSEPVFVVMYVINISAQEKICIYWSADGSTAGSGTAPRRRELVGKWVNTSSQITSAQLANQSAGDFAADSNFTVLGTD